MAASPGWAVIAGMAASPGWAVIAGMAAHPSCNCWHGSEFRLRTVKVAFEQEILNER